MKITNFQIGTTIYPVIEGVIEHDTVHQVVLLRDPIEKNYRLMWNNDFNTYTNKRNAIRDFKQTIKMMDEALPF